MMRWGGAITFLAVLSAAQAAQAKPGAAWIAAAPLEGSRQQPATIEKSLKTQLEKGAVCRNFDPLAGKQPPRKKDGTPAVKAKSDWLLCRSEKGWKEKDPAKRAAAKKAFIAKRAGQWEFRFSDGFNPQGAKDKAQTRDARVEKSLRSQFSSPYGVTVARVAGADADLRDGLNAMVSLQSRYHSRRNPAGIDQIHGRVRKPEDSIKIGARLWSQYQNALSRKNSDLVAKYKETGDINTLVALAYRFGPGRVLQWAGRDDVLRLPKTARRFAQEYQSNFDTVKGAAVEAMSEAAALASASILSAVGRTPEAPRVETPVPPKTAPESETLLARTPIPIPTPKPIQTALPHSHDRVVPTPKPKPRRALQVQPARTAEIKTHTHEPHTHPARTPLPSPRPRPRPAPRQRSVRQSTKKPHTHEHTHPARTTLPQTTIRARAGRLNLRSAATGETLALAFNGRGLNAADQRRFDRIMRDKSGKSASMSPKLVLILGKIQERYPGKTITIISGYRSPEYNAALRRASMKRNNGKSGVAKNSRHMKNDAADIRVEGVGIKELARFARSLKAGGVGYYPGKWVHVDAGRVRTW